MSNNSPPLFTTTTTTTTINILTLSLPATALEWLDQKRLLDSRFPPTSPPNLESASRASPKHAIYYRALYTQIEAVPEWLPHAIFEDAQGRLKVQELLRSEEALPLRNLMDFCQEPASAILRVTASSTETANRVLLHFLRLLQLIDLAEAPEPEDADQGAGEDADVFVPGDPDSPSSAAHARRKVSSQETLQPSRDFANRLAKMMGELGLENDGASSNSSIFSTPLSAPASAPLPPPVHKEPRHGPKYTVYSAKSPDVRHSLPLDNSPPPRYARLESIVEHAGIGLLSLITSFYDPQIIVQPGGERFQVQPHGWEAKVDGIVRAAPQVQGSGIDAEQDHTPIILLLEAKRGERSKAVRCQEIAEVIAFCYSLADSSSSNLRHLREICLLGFDGNEVFFTIAEWKKEYEEFLQSIITAPSEYQTSIRPDTFLQLSEYGPFSLRHKAGLDFIIRHILQLVMRPTYPLKEATLFKRDLSKKY